MKNKIREQGSKAKKFIFGGGLVSMLGTISVSNYVKINPNLTKEDGVGAILTIIFDIAFYIGAIGVVMGIFLTIQSFMSDNPEKRNQGVTLAIVGAVLMGLEMLLKSAGITA